jgi:Fic family protein
MGGGDMADIVESKHKMSVEENILFAKRNIVDLIYKSARLEGLAVTYPDTYSVINGGIINGMSFEDAQIINNLKHAWQFVLSTTDYPVNLNYICQIHKYVGESINGYNAGFLRNTTIRVTVGDEEPFVPDLLTEADARSEISEIMSIENATDRAISLMLHLSRRQMFNDGNKRVAMLAANQVTVANGDGVISVPPKKLGQFIGHLVNYYKSNDMSPAKMFIYENCISGNGAAKTPGRGVFAELNDKVNVVAERDEGKSDMPKEKPHRERGGER